MYRFGRRVMMHPRDYLPALDHIEAALEASCGALITLQSIRGAPTDRTYDADGMHAHVAQAVVSLREAIEELRSAQSSGTSGLALGFVLSRNRHAPAGAQSAGGQSRPRRTA
jgi:hypothetical protein